MERHILELGILGRSAGQEKHKENLNLRDGRKEIVMGGKIENETAKEIIIQSLKDIAAIKRKLHIALKKIK